MNRRLRGLRLFSSSQPYFNSINRNVLDLSPFTVAQSLKRSKPNNKNALQINFFLQAVVYNDIPSVKRTLQKFQGQPGIQVMDHTHAIDSIYFQCLATLFQHIVTSKNPHLHIRELKSIWEVILANQDMIKAFKLDNKSKEMLILKKNILLSFLLTWENSTLISLKDSIVDYSIDIFKAIGLEYIHLAHLLDPFDDGKVRKVFNYGKNEESMEEPKVIEDIVTPTKSNPTSKFHNKSEFMSVKDLCRYIQVRSPHTKDRSSPMYQLYDSLDSDFEREAFLLKYLEFNSEKQLVVEQNCQDLIPEIKPKSSMGANFSFQSSNSNMIHHWYKAFQVKLEELVVRCSSDEVELSSDEQVIYKNLFILNNVPLESVAYVVMSTIISATVYSKDGKSSVTETSNQLSRSLRRLVVKYCSNNEILLNQFSIEDGMILSISLINIFNASANFPHLDGKPFYLENIPYEKDGYYTNHKIGVIKCHDSLSDEFKLKYDSFCRREVYLPMLTPPIPWVSPIEGGYFNQIRPIVLGEERGTYLEYLKQAHMTGQLTSLYQSLNNLGSTAWAINPKMLQILSQVMKIRSGFLKIPEIKPKKSKEIKLLQTTRPKRESFQNDREYFLVNSKHKQKEKRLMEEYYNKRSLRHEYEYTHALATAFAQNGDMMYFPHGFDFRGRVYPLTSTLSFYQDDLVRSLLMFWYSKPLGKSGLNWLKYQLAGVYGKDKLNYHNRIEFIDSNWDLILDSAKNPLHGKKWWLDGDKPWQTLSLCQEMDSISKYVGEGGKLEEYKCRIPIHQDGSCNGLQHYAALGADPDIGKAVNLIPHSDGERGDVYSSVLEDVRVKVASDVHQTSEDSIPAIALPLLTRKVLKQTVMTSVYGVTRTGAHRQIKNKLQDILDNGKIHGQSKSITPSLAKRLNENLGQVSEYLAVSTIKSMDSLFASAKRIQDWLMLNCYTVVTSIDWDAIVYNMGQSNATYPDFFGAKTYNPMKWTSISGFPVIQQYKHLKHKVLTASTLSMKINDSNELGRINIQKQINGIAPNFIHSIDSIHMQMTCQEAYTQGLTFQSVHDSFWTHPKDVNELNEIIRKEFVRLHSFDILGNLKSDLEYTTRHSVHLVYVKIDENEEFCSRLMKLRQLYFKDMKYTKRVFYNRAMFQEARELLTGNGSQSEYKTLLNTYKPEYYFPWGKKMIKYSETSTMKDFTKSEIKLKTFMPILVPIKITNTPTRGNLDVKKVIDSEFFFS
ncbi:DNA-directed RNA polymerase, mitochondrial [[Candida] anglica]|uniref:DNA-directed RNA polymerase n=1 Tax=[Candida] anglica TaxID=148631 RepID=A0ABP0EEW0_9ASCO